MEWMLLPLKRYADFRGRSRRKEFWMFMLLYALVWFACLALMVAGAGSGLNSITLAVGILFGVWWLGTLVPCAAVSVRRLHDRDLSGALYLVFLGGWLIPFVGMITFVAYVVLMVLEGTPGENRYGPDTTEDGLASVFA